jgi:hypothetical protein
MKNNEWNVPSDYFEKNKKALMPVRKMTNRNWLFALAAACFVGIGLFMWKGEDQVQEVAKVENQNEKQKEKENENEGKRGEEIGAKNLSPKSSEGKNEKQNENENEEKRGEEKVKEGKRREDIAEGLKEIPREELVAYLLEEDSELIENLN